MEWLHSILMTNMLYLFLVAGLWLASFALITPGTGVYELMAFVCLGLVGVGIAFVPVRWWALGILLLGVAFFIIALIRKHEAFWLIPSGVALSVGSVFLFRIEGVLIAVDPLLAILISLLTMGFYWVALRNVIQAQLIKPVMDPDALIGMIGNLRTATNPTGSVYVNGELWTACSDEHFDAGNDVRIVARKGLVLTVAAIK